jgi:hypothetical protein
MRNHLANEVLNTDMLNLMQAYKQTSGRKDLDATIELVSVLSKFIKFFSDLRPVRSMSDTRLDYLTEVENFFVAWHEQPNRSYTNNFITKQCYDDLLSICIGFKKILESKLAMYPTSYVAPARVNTDVVENFFCSQRNSNGSNDNPTSLQYCKTVNTIIISKKLVSTKSNAGGKVSIGGARPYKCYKDQSFRSLRL